MNILTIRSLPALVLSAMVAGALIAGPATPSFAAGETKATDAGAKKKKKRDPGKRLYLRKTCLACHGKDGRKAIQNYPNLAGQDAKYMVKQIEDILAGKRKGSPDATGNPRAEGMRGALVTADGERRITKDEVKQISTWLSKLEPAAIVAPEPPVGEARMAEGKKAYKKAKCRTCHGPDGKKPLKTYPYVAGQKRSYIVAQMTDMREKARTNGKSKLMFPFVKKLDDAQIELLADYLSQTDRTAK